MKILESVRLAMQIFPNSFINHNNALYWVYILPNLHKCCILSDI